MQALRQEKDSPEVQSLLEQDQRNIRARSDRLFAGLMAAQWIAAIVSALLISPRIGGTSAGVNLFVAIFLGGVFTIVPIALSYTRRAAAVTRHTMAAAQMLFSALLIHLTGGKSEIQYHVFASLALLALYRDWRVLATATIVVGADYLVRGAWLNESIVGILSSGHRGWMEQAGWVALEDAILMMGCLRSQTEMLGFAHRAAALRESQERMRLIVFSALDAVIIFDGSGNIAELNPQAQKLFGYTANEATGKSMPLTLLSNPESEKLAQDIAAFVKTGAAQMLGKRIEVTARRRDGERFPAELAISPVRWGDGWVFSAFVRDLAERKAQEEREHLKMAKESAEAANRAKTAFLANMSHEIRTPMTAILGYAELLLEPSRTLSDRQDTLHMIRRNAQHLMHLINDILDISKIEAGKMTVELLPTHLPRLLGEVLSMIRPRVLDRELELGVVFDGPIPTHIRSDPLRLKQILMNLLSNAVKFTYQGKITLRVSCRASESGSTIQFNIADSGVGMTAAQVSRLFQPFCQADESTTRKFGGTGLGLAISRQLAVLLGGDISVKSSPMEGSDFQIVIEGGPLGGVEMLEGPAEKFIGSDEVERESPLGIHIQGRILLAEDGPDNQALISMHLKNAGATVELADNGRAAVAMARQQTFDLILMDMQMPELDGYGAASELRRRGFTLPIIALTAHALSGDRQKCLEAGCTDYLTKPIDKAELIRVVASFLHRPVSAQAEPTPQPAAAADDTPIKRAMDGFISRLPLRIETLRRHLDAKDLKELGRSLHQLKGAGAGYGFPQITQAAAEAEAKVNQQADLDQIAAAVNELVGIIQSVRDAATATPLQA